MKQTADESKFIPLSLEKGRARKVQSIRLAYAMLSDLKTAHVRRLSFFATEGQGFTHAVSHPHNTARFRARARNIPARERLQIAAAKDAKRTAERKAAIIALRYGKRYGTTGIGTIQRAITAGIMIKVSPEIMPYAEFRRRLIAKMGSGMMGKQS